MADVDWGTQDNQATPKKRVPTWVWIGGGCCGVAVLAVIAISIFSFVVGRKMMDQEGNWESLAKSVPYDESAKREDVMIISNPAAWMAPGIEGMWQIVNAGEHWEAMFIEFDAKHAKELREQFFDPDGSQAGQLSGAMAQHNTEVGKLDVQGRSLTCLRFTTQKEDEKPADAKEGEAGQKGVFDELKKGVANEFKKAMAIVDITPDGADNFVVFTYAHKGSLKRLDDGELQDFLQPYHIGPNR